MLKSTDMSKMIEEAASDGLANEFAIYSSEVEALTIEQIRSMLPLVGVVFAKVDSVDADTCRLSLRETTWSKYLEAHQRVTGRSSALDSRSPRSA